MRSPIEVAEGQKATNSFANVILGCGAVFGVQSQSGKFTMANLDVSMFDFVLYKYFMAF